MSFYFYFFRYEDVLKIIDHRWEIQLHRPLHAAAYYLNPKIHYRPGFKASYDVKQGLYACMERMLTSEERDLVDLQLEEFKDRSGLFGSSAARAMLDKKLPAQWWDSYGDHCPELQNFAVRILSLTCSSSGAERNWSTFERVRNFIHDLFFTNLIILLSFYNEVNYL